MELARILIEHHKRVIKDLEKFIDSNQSPADSKNLDVLAQLDEESGIVIARMNRARQAMNTPRENNLAPLPLPIPAPISVPVPANTPAPTPKSKGLPDAKKEKYPVITRLSQYPKSKQNEIIRNIYNRAVKNIEGLVSLDPTLSDKSDEMIGEEADRLLAAYLENS